MGTLVSLVELTAGLAFGLWLGVTLAVSFLVVPQLFGRLATGDADRVVADLLSRQYQIGGGLSVVGLFAAVGAGVLGGFDLFAAASVAGGLVTFAAVGYALVALVPVFADGGAEPRHHRRILLVDAFTLLGGGVAFVGLYF
ncbi:MAG: hypothetical protein J07HB67_01604 [halophilic archaeon J07HB67]|nr:MAG: hypothetical protein J07HB67_01604 [halophilic archaeon J07HB67]